MHCKIVSLCFKRLGQHWYLDTNHIDPTVLMMDRKIERLFNLMDIYQNGYIMLDVIQQGIIIHSLGLVEVKDEDVTRYLSTDCPFNMTVKINGHDFEFNSNFIKLLEENYEIDLANDIYRITIWNEI